MRVFLFAFPFTLLSFQHLPGQEITFDQLEKRNEIVYLVENNMPYNGKCFAYYENGNKKHEVNYKDGKLDGEVKLWYKNGRMSVHGRYKDGQREGKYTVWRENRPTGIYLEKSLSP